MSSIRDDKFFLIKLDGLIKVKWNRKLPTGKRTSCTITKEPSGKYYVSFLIEVEKTVTIGQGYLGIDAGLTDLVTFSNGTSLPNPRHYVKSQKRLSCLQRRLSRKQKGSKNKNKARLKVALIHEEIHNQRRDYLHKLSTNIVRDNQAVCIESLRVKNMIRNRRLSKHIADAGWGMFREMLKYKATHSTGCKLYLADPWYPSTQLCSSCLKKPEVKLKIGTRKWTCLHYGTLHQRDHNASMNLLHLAENEHKIYKDHEKSVFVLEPFR
jgi:putative transposase